jgi:hypothetical protein
MAAAVISKRGRPAGRKSYFLKKEAKNFCSFGYATNCKWAAHANEQKFFGSFFQKRTLPFLPALGRDALT